LKAQSVKKPLKRILLFCAASEYPRHDAEHESNFHENLSWGGHSARTAAAQALLDVTRASKTRDPQIMAAIRELARDKNPEVRLQIIQNLQMLRLLDPVWIWSELEHVIAKEVTRGVVGAAIESVARIAYLDIPRSIRAAKSVLRRYRTKNMPGVVACRSSAEALIFDIHIHGTDDEADKFAAAFMDKVVSNADNLRQLIARYSANLLNGSLENPEAADNRPRRMTIEFYSSITEKAFSEIEARVALLDIRKFDTWPETDQTAVRDMFGILDEVSLRIHVAAGTHYDGSVPSDDVSPQRARLYWESKPILTRLTNAITAPIAHHLIQALETFVPLDPAGVFQLIAQAVKSAEQGGYSDESMAADLGTWRIIAPSLPIVPDWTISWIVWTSSCALVGQPRRL
jgi:hypothetical protein